MKPNDTLIDYQTEAYSNEIRQQRYYQKLPAYYGGTFPLEYQRRVNRGLEAQRKLRAYWRERERLSLPFLQKQGHVT